MACTRMLSWTASPLLTSIPDANFSQVLGIIVLRILSSYRFNGKRRWLKIQNNENNLCSELHSTKYWSFHLLETWQSLSKPPWFSVVQVLCSWVLVFNLYQQASLLTLIWSATFYSVFSIHLWTNQRRPIKSGNKEYCNSWSFINACM